MAMTAADLNRRDDFMDRIRTAWSHLTNEERSALEIVVNSIIRTHGSVEDPLFPSLTEAELFERIDRSLSEADANEYVDAEVFEREIEAEFGLL